MNLVTLRSYIDTFINTKYGEDKITGAVHNLVLHEMITSLLEIAGTGFGGDLLPTDNPGAQSAPVYFMASETGTYTFCGGVQVTTIPAFVVWNGTAWGAKNIGLPQGVGEASKCQGLAFANDPQPLGKSVGDWYVFMGGGSLTWSIAMLSPGIVYLKSKTGGDVWAFIPFGGDARFKGIIEPATAPIASPVNGDYYIARTAGDYSAFTGIDETTVIASGQLKYNGSTQQWVFYGFTGGGGGTVVSNDVHRTISFNNLASLMCRDYYKSATSITEILAQDVATLEISTDNITFTPITLPLTAALVVTGAVWWRITYASGQETATVTINGTLNG